MVWGPGFQIQRAELQRQPAVRIPHLWPGGILLGDREARHQPFHRERDGQLAAHELARGATYRGTGFHESPRQRSLPAKPVRGLRGNQEGLQGRQPQLLVQLRSEEHTSELQSLAYLVCRLLLEKKKT